jgi:hypothetical protein
MISKQMRDWGANGNSIREIAAYGERRAAEIGAERFLFRPHTEISVLFHHEIGDLVDAFDSAGAAVSVDKNCQILQKGAFIIIWIHSLPLLSCAAVRQQKRRRGNIIPTFPLQQKLRDVGQLFDRKRIAHSQK